MVQILPGIFEGFGTNLGEVIGKAAEQIQRKHAQTTLEKMFGQNQPENPNQQPSQPLANGQMPQQNQGQLTNQLEGNVSFNPINVGNIHKLAEKAYGTEAANQITRGYIEQQKLQGKEAATIRAEERAEKRAGITERTKATTGNRESINAQRQSLLSARNAISSGDVGAFSRNSFADLFGEAGKRFKTASGSQLEAATKHLLIDSLSEVSAKGTNLWLEKVAKSAAPELGKSEEANDTLITMALGNLDIKEKKLDIEQALLAEYDRAGIKPPPDFEKTVDSLLSPYSKQIQDQVSYDTRVIYEKEKGERYLNNLEKVPKGTPLTLEKRDALLKKFNGDREKVIQIAERLGYKIPDPSTIRSAKQQEPENPIPLASPQGQ